VSSAAVDTVDVTVSMADRHCPAEAPIIRRWEMNEEAASIAAAYRRFADEARGRSALYEELASRVTADDELINFLLTLPPEKRQPNLLLAAARRLCGTPSGGRIPASDAVALRLSLHERSLPLSC
jgi:hypothetical protein